MLGANTPAAYRGPAEVDRPEDESAALRELGRRRSRLRAVVIVVALVAGVALGLGGCVLLTELQFVLLGRAWLLVSIPVGFFPPWIASGIVGLRIARWAVRQRADAWISEVAAIHKVPRDAIAEDALLLQRIEAVAELDATDG
jgi:hypothetical protein